MPTYVYRCDQCSSLIERRQRFTDPPLTVCEECAGLLRRVMQPVGIIFKGSGFYSTDYKNGGASNVGDSMSDAPKTTTSSESEAAPATNGSSKSDEKATKISSQSDSKTATVSTPSSPSTAKND